MKNERKLQLEREWARGEVVRRQEERAALILRQRVEMQTIINENKTRIAETLHTAAVHGVKECPICFTLKMCVLNYHCIHAFCTECLLKWEKNCPLCRSE